jgi:hypothetical protein
MLLACALHWIVVLVTDIDGGKSVGTYKHIPRDFNFLGMLQVSPNFEVKKHVILKQLYLLLVQL